MALPPLSTAGLVVAVTFLALTILRGMARIGSREHSLPRSLLEGTSAERLVYVGQIFGVLLIAASAVKNAAEGQDIVRDFVWSLVLTAVGVLLFLVTGRVGTRFLFGSRLRSALERGNTAAGLAAGAHYAASGIITAAGMAGSDLRGLGLSLIFFVLAQGTLHGAVSLFRALTTYDDAEQIEGENVAAAVSYGGVALSVAVIVGRALEGHFVSWEVSLKEYAEVLVSLVAFYPVRQLFVQSLLLGGRLTLRGGCIDGSIASDHNAGVAAAEAVSYLAVALAIARLA